MRSLAAALALAGLASGVVPPRALSPGSARATEAAPREVVAIRAGTAHLVEEGQILRGGATVLVVDGEIAAVGPDVAIPVDAHVIDYGPDAVLVPGFVATDSSSGSTRPSERTADPRVRAIDAIDLREPSLYVLAGGVTSAYLVPARGRLIAGQGALVKLAGSDPDARVLAATAAIDGSIAADARRTPGYWEPPVPATVDVGIGFPEPQLPRTTMGAIVALRTLLAAALEGRDAPEFGPGTAAALASLHAAGVPWRVRAEEEDELRAIVGFARTNRIPLVIHGAADGAEVAELLGEAGFPVIYESPFVPNARGRDLDRSPDTSWGRLDTPKRLVDAGARVAIDHTGSTRDLRFAAALASQGGLDPEVALRAITLTPAEIFGVDDRIGSIAPGKDADLVVLNGPPLDTTSSVLAVVVDGKTVWTAHETSAVVLEVDALHVGDGTVLRPGELLLQEGRIVEVGERVAHPEGATVVRGRAAMPGMIDALAHLGLEGAEKVPDPDFRFARILAPGDEVDRRVARAGVTTVVLGSRGTSSRGAPMSAYKPAAESWDGLVVDDPAAIRLEWSESDRFKSGDDVRDLLEDLVEYLAEWEEYERELAEWRESPPEEEDEDEEEEEEAEDEDGEEEDDEEEEEEVDPVLGIWEGRLGEPEAGGAAIRIQMRRRTGAPSELEGVLRSPAVASRLVPVEGELDETAVTLRGLGEGGTFELVLELDDGKLEGELVLGGDVREAALERTAVAYPVAAWPPLKKAPPEEVPRGKPREPRLDSKLEPLVRAARGEAAVVVDVERADEILDCVEAFEEVGIRPILYGAEDAHRVVGRLRGRVAGILPHHRVRVYEPERGTNDRNAWAELQNAGIPVAFHSNAEEGAADLPWMAAYAIASGLSPEGALRALTADCARMMAIDERVGALREGLDADVLLLDGPPALASTRVLRAWVNGREVRAR